MVIKAALLLAAIRVGLWLLPFRVLRRLLAWVTEAPVKPRRSERLSVDRVVWAVESAGRRMPWAKTCLTQGMATQLLLSRRGQQCLLQIGVLKGEEGQFEAHAWVESGGRVVIGDHELGRYTRLVALEEKP